MEMEGRSRDINNKRVGDEHSSLLDQFERDSFQARLNQALLLGRSFSAPNAPRLLANAPPLFLFPLPPPQQQHQQEQQKHSRRSKLSKALKKLLKPFLLRKCRTSKDPDPDDLKSRRAFSRSCRA
ncbi:hypothetical protein MRB53_002868 [Persea americana]|uniref:Uncharacterized protein n=1 Tax=Persea americana TaxID=3435 RepID=A0ACC2MW19_PERAE|nr:hypothetical protein MRB53_002868 [Persea americana]|eukprot:TRINITY_DN26171_c0_g1_i1.p1 TRINITY_DN26171_c0_g1~~TRINITY_DN26171_c0_g1_i1.p1  ORF type:complete len:141 (+),score=37.07 TRINITY_DN26171_c0_g1_i1:50-424(+)